MSGKTIEVTLHLPAADDRPSMLMRVAYRLAGSPSRPYVLPLFPASPQMSLAQLAAGRYLVGTSPADAEEVSCAELASIFDFAAQVEQAMLDGAKGFARGGPAAGSAMAFSPTVLTAERVRRLFAGPDGIKLRSAKKAQNGPI